MSIKVKRISDKKRRILDKYRALIKTREKKGEYLGVVKRGNSSKNKILNFYENEGRWPTRLSKSKFERKLAQRFENFVAKTSGTYDAAFRRIVMAFGRKSNGKRGHDVKGTKQAILDFINTHGRVPSTPYKSQIVEGEANLRRALDYYTTNRNDMTLLGKVYEVDKCHKSGIPAKYRALINQALDVKKPLIRLV